MLPRRRLISLSPRYLLTWQCRRFSMVPIPYPWMLPCRRPHPAPCLSMSLRRLVLAQLPRFLLIRLCRFLHIAVWCNLTLPHNSTSLSSSLAGFTQTDLLIVGILFVSPRHQYCAHVAPLPPPGLEQPALPPVIQTLIHSTVLHDVATTTDHGVLYWLYQRSSGPPKLCSSVPVISTRSTCLAAATARTRTARPAFGSRYWFSLVHYTWCIYYSCTSTSPATLSYFSVTSTEESCSTIHVGTQHARSATKVREVPVLLWWEGTILLLQILVQGLFLFLNRVLSFFLWSILVNPNLNGTLALIQLTLISCIVNSDVLSFYGTKPGAQTSYQHCLRCLW